MKSNPIRPTKKYHFSKTPPIPQSLEQAREFFKKEYGADYWEVDTAERRRRHDESFEHYKRLRDEKQ